MADEPKTTDTEDDAERLADRVAILVTPDHPTGTTAATATVNEAGLPARGAEPAGSNPSAPSEGTTTIHDDVQGTVTWSNSDLDDLVLAHGVHVIGRVAPRLVPSSL